MSRLRFAVAIAALCAIAPLAACGSGEGLVRAAEPFKSPPITKKPAGRVVPIGHKPEGLAADPKTRLLAVGLTNPDAIALVNMDTLRVVKRIPLDGPPRHLALAARGGPVLVPAEKTNELIEVSLPSGKLRTSRVGRLPHDTAGDEGDVFVGEEGGDHLTFLRDGREIGRLPAPVQPGGVAVNKLHQVAVVGVSERALELYDGRERRSLGKIDVGVGPTHVASLDRRFFVADTRGNALLEVRTEPLRIHRRTEVRDAPYGLTADIKRRRLWVTQTKTNRLVELTDRHDLRSFPTVRQPNSVAVDPKTGRIFVASRADGTLQAIEAPRD